MTGSRKLGEQIFAGDSGAVTHVITPKTAEAFKVESTERSRKGLNFTAANGGRMTHHGTARVSVVNEKLPMRRSTMAIEAADISRSLQSTGATCYHDKEVLFTKTACYVVAEGLLSPHLKKEDICQAFKREP